MLDVHEKKLPENAQTVFKFCAWLKSCFPKGLSLEKLLLSLFCRWEFQPIPAPGEECSLARGKSSDHLLALKETGISSYFIFGQMEGEG